MNTARRVPGGPPIGRIGIGCRFPGGGTDVENLWELLRVFEGGRLYLDKKRIARGHFHIADAADCGCGRSMTGAPRGILGDGVALVGIGCRFRGGVNSPDSFWRLLCEGLDAIGEIPRDRIDVARYYDVRPATPGRIIDSEGRLPWAARRV